MNKHDAREIEKYLEHRYLISKERLDQAFGLAENDTAEHFNSQTCSMVNKDGESECPICYFRQRVKHHLEALRAPKQEI